VTLRLTGFGPGTLSLLLPVTGQSLTIAVDVFAGAEAEFEPSRFQGL